MSWTHDHEAELRRRWEAGETAAEIAAALPGLPATANKPARPVTRDMVIGKAHRLGLEARPSPIRRQAA
jgi:GcrA cell cycle regulator